MNFSLLVIAIKLSLLEREDVVVGAISKMPFHSTGVIFFASPCKMLMSLAARLLVRLASQRGGELSTEFKLEVTTRERG